MKKNPAAILFITDLFEAMGGAERNLTHIIKNINKEKFRPTLCCLRAGELADSLRDKGFNVIDLKIKRIYSPYAFKKLLYLLSLIRKEDIKLIITYHESSDFFGLVLSKIAGIPIISSKRDMGYNLKSYHILAYKLTGMFFNNIITVSDAVNKIVRKYNRVSTHKIQTIYNGVDCEKYRKKINIKEKKEEIGIRHDTAFVGCIAGLRSIKGIKYFIKAAAIVLKEVKNTQFLIIGNDPGESGYTRKDMEKIACELGIKQDIFFLGKRDDVPELLSVIDISVLSSLSEGFSNTILESMAAGKPVVATDVGGNPEIVENGKTGFLVPPEDPEALATSIIFLLKNKKIAGSMGKEALNRVQSKFNLRKMMQDNEDLYEFIIKKHRTCRVRWIDEIYLKSSKFIIKGLKMTIAGAFYYTGVIKIYLWTRKIFGKSIVKIIAYHNISKSYPSYLGISMKPDIFEKQIQFLKNSCDIVSLHEAHELLKKRKHYKDTVVFTFDDSYKEYFTVLFPILQKHKIPATIFISTGPLDNGFPLHVDLLIYAIHNTKKKFLELKQPNLRTYFLDTFTARENAVHEINDYLKNLPEHFKIELIKEIYKKLGIDFNDMKRSGMVLTWADVEEMSKNGIEFGCHSITHPDLVMLSDEDAREEISGSKDRIEKNTGGKPSFFAYPFGGRNNINDRIVEHVKSLGFKGAVTLVKNGYQDFDSFLIPRMGIGQSSVSGPMGNFSKSLFAAEISGIADYLFLRFLFQKSKGLPY